MANLCLTLFKKRKSRINCFNEVYVGLEIHLCSPVSLICTSLKDFH